MGAPNNDNNHNKTIQKNTASNIESVSKTNRGNVVLGLVLLAIFASLVLWAIISYSNTSPVNQLGTLQGASQVRVGKESKIMLPSVRVRSANPQYTVEWYMDEVKVGESLYNGEELSYMYTPMQVGEHTFQARAGKQSSDKLVVTVNNPLLEITVDDVTITYGETLPQLSCSYIGLLDGDSLDIVDTDMQYQVLDYTNQVGVYDITLQDTEQKIGRYDVICNTGKLVVLPKTLTIIDSYTKEYDGTNYIDNVTVQLDGIIEGDDVVADCDKIYFADKNVGDKQILTSNIELMGKDSKNYILSSDTINGSITTKVVKLKGTRVADKLFDGTTSADIVDVGQLEGIIEGDIVAIGKVQARFRDARVGKNKQVVISEYRLVGKDKCNYEVKDSHVRASIVSRLSDILLNKDEVMTKG